MSEIKKIEHIGTTGGIDGDYSYSFSDKNHFIFVPEDLWNEEDEEDSEDEIADEEEFTKTSKKDKVETVEICKDLGNNFVLIKLF